MLPGPWMACSAAFGLRARAVTSSSRPSSSCWPWGSRSNLYIRGAYAALSRELRGDAELTGAFRARVLNRIVDDAERPSAATPATSTPRPSSSTTSRTSSAACCSASASAIGRRPHHHPRPGRHVLRPHALHRAAGDAGLRRGGRPTSTSRCGDRGPDPGALGHVGRLLDVALRHRRGHRADGARRLLQRDRSPHGADGQIEHYLDNVLLQPGGGAAETRGPGRRRARRPACDRSSSRWWPASASRSRSSTAWSRFDAALQTFSTTTRDFREFNLHLKDNVQRMSLGFGDVSEALKTHVTALKSRDRRGRRYRCADDRFCIPRGGRRELLAVVHRSHLDRSRSILFVLVLLAYVQNLISGKKLNQMRLELGAAPSGWRCRSGRSATPRGSCGCWRRICARPPRRSRRPRLRQAASEEEVGRRQQRDRREQPRSWATCARSLQGIAVLRVDVLDRVKRSIEAELGPGAKGRRTRRRRWGSPTTATSSSASAEHEHVRDPLHRRPVGAPPRLEHPDARLPLPGPHGLRLRHLAGDARLRAARRPEAPLRRCLRARTRDLPRPDIPLRREGTRWFDRYLEILLPAAAVASGVLVAREGGTRPPVAFQALPRTTARTYALPGRSNLRGWPSRPGRRRRCRPRSRAGAAARRPSRSRSSRYPRLVVTVTAGTKVVAQGGLRPRAGVNRVQLANYCVYVPKGNAAARLGRPVLPGRAVRLSRLRRRGLGHARRGHPAALDARDSDLRMSGPARWLAPLVALALVPALAGSAADPGVTSTRILLGGTVPLTGEASAFGSVGPGAKAYFDYVNAKGGVNGRRIVYRYYDDGYDPAQTVQLTRRSWSRTGCSRSSTRSVGRTTSRSATT